MGKQEQNLLLSRTVFDNWYDEKPRPRPREEYWVRLVAALLTESNCMILAHTGEWHGGGYINEAQKAVLRTSSQYPHDGFGSNGGSVGPLQQIPTPVAQLATDQFTGQSKAWDGWGTIEDCMAFETSIPKFLNVLNVSDDTYYKGKPMASAIVADLLRVQQPLASEVDNNYGGFITAGAQATAAQYPQHKDWFTNMSASNWEEAKAELVQALAGIEGRVATAVANEGTLGEIRRQMAVLLGAREPVAEVNEHSISDQTWSEEFPDRMSAGAPTAVHSFITETNARSVVVEQKVDALSEKLDKVLALLEAK